MTFPWLTTLALLPAVGAAVMWLLPAAKAGAARVIAMATALLVLAVTIAMTLQFDMSKAGQRQFVQTYSWIESLRVSYSVGIDGLALTLLWLTVVLVPVCILASWHTHHDSATRFFYSLMLALESCLVLVFAAQDVFLFYLFFELMLLPVFLLIGRYGGTRKQYAAMKFLLYNLLGGLIMLAALIGLYTQSRNNPQGMLLSNLQGITFSSQTMERLLFLGFFAAFAIKAPLWPLHTWLPDSASQAPPSVAVLLVGVMDKVGTYGMLAFCLPLFPNASKWAAPVIVTLAVISILYGAIAAIGQQNLLRLIAYTSISHFGFIVLGIFAMTSAGHAGAGLYMISHGLTTAGLFLSVAMLQERRGLAQLDSFGGLQRSTPLLAGLFLVSGLATLALPGTSGFVGELLVFVGTYARYPVAAGIAVLGIVLAALYILLPYQRVFTGPPQAFAQNWRDLSHRELAVLAPVVALIVLLGFYPKPVLDAVNPPAQQTLSQLKIADPQPEVAAKQGGK